MCYHKLMLLTKQQKKKANRFLRIAKSSQEVVSLANLDSCEYIG